MHQLRTLIQKKPDLEILKLAKAKTSEIFSEKYIKELDSDIKFQRIRNKGNGLLIFETFFGIQIFMLSPSVHAISMNFQKCHPRS